MDAGRRKLVLVGCAAFLVGGLTTVLAAGAAVLFGVGGCIGAASITREHVSPDGGYVLLELIDGFQDHTLWAELHRVPVERKGRCGAPSAGSLLVRTDELAGRTVVIRPQVVSEPAPEATVEWAPLRPEPKGE